MGTDKITEEMKNVLMRLRTSDGIFVLMSEFTRMPFVECDAETFDDEVFLYFEEAEAQNAAKERTEKGDRVQAVKIAKQLLLPFYTSLYPMGVNCLVVNGGTDKEMYLQLSDLVVRNLDEAEKQGRPVIENQELHLTALYFIQKLRSLPEPQLTEELRELNEEMMAHYMRSQLLVAVTEEHGAPILKQKDGKALQPVFTDMQEFMKFQTMNRNEKFKTAVVEAGKLSEMVASEVFGVTVNPFGVNLVLQLPNRQA